MELGQTMKLNNWRLVCLTMIFILAFFVAACASMQQKMYHGIFMKGSILETYDSEIYLCVGSKDGASVGQELDVYKIHISAQPKSPPVFKRENTGKVKITEIIDEHFAKAQVISGKAEKNSIVELVSP